MPKEPQRVSLLKQILKSSGRITEYFQNLGAGNLLLSGLVVLIGIILLNLDNWYQNTWGINIGTEILGIVATVFIIDYLNYFRRKDRKFNRLKTAIQIIKNREKIQEAIDELRLEGMTTFRYEIFSQIDLADLSFSNFRFLSCEFVGVDFSNSVFEQVDFSGSSFSNSIFDNADITAVDFSGVKLSKDWSDQHKLFASASNLQGAVMPNGSNYDGRYRLEKDIEHAAGITRSPEDMAAFYEITKEEYLDGQRWADMHLDKFQGKTQDK